MEFTRGPGSAADLRCDLLVVAAFDDLLRAGEPLALLDARLDGLLARVVEQEDFKAKPGQSLIIHTHGRIGADRVLIVGIGRRAAFERVEVRAVAARAARTARSIGARSVGIALATGAIDARTVQLVAEGILLGRYRFDRYCSEDRRRPDRLESVAIVAGSPTPGTREAAPPVSLDDRDFAAAVERGRIIAEAIGGARDLVNEPASVVTPRHLAAEAQRLAEAYGLEVKILDRAACEALGMGCFLGVARGSVEEPRFVHLAYRPPRPSTRRVCLVGKGVTFDSGGLSLKPSQSMQDMKTDMAGAATVLYAVAAVARLGVEVEVHAIAACAENMPSGSAYRLGDVLRSMAGKTVEITNTDAEGRLTLADALSYATRLEPTEILDFATLTGAVVIALGPRIAGVMGNDDAVMGRWLAAGKVAGEEMWRLPLPEHLKDQLRSEIADLKNSGERWGSALVAGLFLKEFVGDVPWVHVDLAGPAFLDKEAGALPKGATGYGIASIVEYLAHPGPPDGDAI